jgi:hypothetical protein
LIRDLYWVRRQAVYIFTLWTFSAPGVVLPSPLYKIEDVSKWVSTIPVNADGSNPPSWVGLPEDSEQVLKLEAAEKISRKLRLLDSVDE